MESSSSVDEIWLREQQTRTSCAENLTDIPKDENHGRDEKGLERRFQLKAKGNILEVASDTLAKGLSCELRYPSPLRSGRTASASVLACRSAPAGLGNKTACNTQTYTDTRACRVIGGISLCCSHVICCTVKITAAKYTVRPRSCATRINFAQGVV